MKFLLFAIPFFSLLSTTFSQAAIPLDHPLEQQEQLKLDQREQVNREVCAWEVSNIINIHQNVLEDTIKQLPMANENEGEDHATIGIYLTKQVFKVNIDCGIRLEKLTLIGNRTDGIEINWEVWKMYQRGEITRTEWLEDFSISVQNKVKFYK
jgi:hypothetical protein